MDESLQQAAPEHGRSFRFVLGSYRANGNTEALARRAAGSLPPEIAQRWIRLVDLELDSFEDRRHEQGASFPMPTGDTGMLLEATMAATDLVIASPLYWYSLSAPTKHYLDHWSGWMRVPGLDFRGRMRGKTMWSISAISEEDPTKADHLLGTLRTTADYLGMEWGGHVLGYANRPGDAAVNPVATAAAGGLFTASVRGA